jgi:hypothetical protein
MQRVNARQIYAGKVGRQCTEAGPQQSSGITFKECVTEGMMCLPLDLPSTPWLKKGVCRVELNRLEKESLTESRKKDGSDRVVRSGEQGRGVVNYTALYCTNPIRQRHNVRATAHLREVA